MNPPERFDLDLGDGHWLEYAGWWPDRDLNPQYDGLPDIERIGATIYHTTDKTETGMCAGFVHFDTPEIAKIVPREQGRWQVQSWDPMTLTPSILCRGCGDHGFIRNGKWERA